MQIATKELAGTEVSCQAPVRRDSFLAFLRRSLDTRYSGLVIASFYLAILILWFSLDQTVPGFDPAWHAIYSSTVRRFLTHAHEWSVDNFVALLRQHFNYPAGGWLINGGIKVILGDSVWGDRGCLIVQTGVLAFSFYQLGCQAWKDRVKANAGLIVLLSTPLICGIQHLPFLDLMQTAAFTSFFAALMFWRASGSWKSTLMTGFLFGLYCSTKQIAVLYGAPVLCGMFLLSLVKKDRKSALQLLTMLVLGTSFLLIWIIPNMDALVSYVVARNQIGLGWQAKGVMIFENLKQSFYLICQGLSPFLFLSLLVLSINGPVKGSLQKTFIPVFASIFGWLFLMAFAYYNVPEARYFGPVVVAFSLVMGGFIGDALNSSTKWRQGFSVLILCLAPIQIVLLSFAQAPVIRAPQVQGVSPVFGAFGIDADFFCIHVPCAYLPDAWKQRWVIDSIESVEKGRYVFLSILPSSPEFNQGSISYLGHLKKSHVIPITWRKCNPDMSDRFLTTAEQVNSVDWFLLKTGYQGGALKPNASSQQFDVVRNFVEKSGNYQLVKTTILPDSSMLKLYRKDYARFWLKQAKLCPPL